MGTSVPRAFNLHCLPLPKKLNQVTGPSSKLKLQTMSFASPSVTSMSTHLILVSVVCSPRGSQTTPPAEFRRFRHQIKRVFSKTSLVRGSKTRWFTNPSGGCIHCSRALATRSTLVPLCELDTHCRHLPAVRLPSATPSVVSSRPKASLGLN